MNMKRILALLTVAVMLVSVSMTACGKEESADVQETVTETKESAEETEESVEEELAEVASPEEIAVDFSRGVTDGQVYTSEFAGFSYTAPEGFRYYDDSEIATIYGLTEELLGENAAETVVYDAYCVDTAGNNISINYENLSGIYGTLMDTASYLSLNEVNITNAFNNMEDVEIIGTSIGTVDVAGTAWDCLNVELNINGAQLYEKILVKEVSGYMAIITAASIDMDMLSTILSGLADM